MANEVVFSKGEMIAKLRELAKGKKVQLCTHWDADGVTSGALIFHLIKGHAKEIVTKTKGKPFIIEQQDIDASSELVICSDIQPGKLDKPIVYIDHHPFEERDFKMMIHDDSAVSTTLLIFDKLMDKESKNNPYYLFLVMLGYLGDGGQIENMPEELKMLAFSLLPELMEKRQSVYSEKGSFYEIERYVSLLNIGKRVHWNGDVPLELLKSIDNHELLTLYIHPLARQLMDYKQKLREAYEQDFEIKTLNGIDLCVISDEKNIQGVIAARYMDDKPIIVLNELNDEVIGSMRVPEFSNIDAGAFLGRLSSKIPTFMGGGHKKAGGFTLGKGHLPLFLEKLKLGVHISISEWD